MSDLGIALFWGPRADQLDACVERTLAWLNLFRAIEPPIPHWTYLAGREWRELRWTSDSIAEMLQRGINHTDVHPRFAILELGYTATLLPKAKRRWHWHASIHCACYSTATPNVVRFDFRPTASGSTRGIDEFDFETWRHLFFESVRIWNPDTAWIETNDDDEFGLDGFRVGPLTYLSHNVWTSEPRVPSVCSVASIDDAGWLIETHPSVFPVLNEADIADLATLCDALGSQRRGAS